MLLVVSSFERAHEIYISCPHAVMRQRPGKMIIVDAEQPIDVVFNEVANAVACMGVGVAA